MGGDQQQQNPLIPDTGAAKYWYVDPSATGQKKDGQQQQDQADNNDLVDALRRLQLLPEGTQPGF